MFIIAIISAFVVVASGLLLMMVLARPKTGSPALQTARPPQPRGLFEQESTNSDPERTEDAVRRQLITRLQNGDWSALSDAHRAGGDELYRDLLVPAVAECADEDLEQLVEYISESKVLRANALLARRLLRRFRLAPSVGSATEMLHITALCDDADIYHEAVDALSDAWRNGKLNRLASGALMELIESQFWVLAPSARQGGAAYKLKRRLADIRRELAAGESVR